MHGTVAFSDRPDPLWSDDVRVLVQEIQGADPQDCPTCRALIEATMRELDRPEAEPVAWAVRFGEETMDETTLHNWMEEAEREAGDEGEIIPLYASPVGHTPGGTDD